MSEHLRHGRWDRITLRSHDATVAHRLGWEVQILDLPAAVRGGPMWPSREEDPLTTPTAEVGHASVVAVVATVLVASFSATEK